MRSREAPPRVHGERVTVSDGPKSAPRDRRVWLAWAAVAWMVWAGSDRLAEQLWRLVSDPSPTGAIDLRSQLDTTRRWFAAEAVYGPQQHTDNHPPATWLLLWPLLGWPTLEDARVLWAVCSVAVLAALAWMTVVVSGARTPTERAIAALTPATMYAPWIAIGNGQLTVQVLAAVMGGLALIVRPRTSFRSDLAGAALITLALAKPTVAAPFFWAVLLLPGRLRPALLVVGSYAALTVTAALVRDGDPVALLRAWLARGVTSAGRGAVSGGYANVHTWLAAAGCSEWSGVAALAMLAALGVWTYHRRDADPWIVAGVAAVVARLWTYHRIYDDALLLVPMVALARTAAGAAEMPTRRRAAATLVLAWVASQAPARLHYGGPPLDVVFAAGQTVVWFGTLAALLSLARPSDAGREA
jgi:hypothetical protein